MQKLTGKMKKKHKKHPIADRIKCGQYHSLEFGIYGTDCKSINELVNKLSQNLNHYNCLFIDADHQENNQGAFYQTKEKQFHYSYKNKHFTQDNVLLSNSAELVFVNGNHYPASNQIIIINPQKEASLKRRVDQLESIFAVIVNKDSNEIYPFIKEKINKETLIIKQENIGLLVNAIKSKIEKPKLKALILAGGKSLRMGEDKSQINYHGKSQEEHLVDLCKSCGLDTYISKGASYTGDLQNVIKDRMIDMGPFGAICTSFMHDRNTAWLVLACDMPFIDKDSIDDLINNRQLGSYATSYAMSNESFPEPTFTIYEPRIYKRMLEFLSLGYTCPRKVLINSSIKKITPKNIKVLRNINSQKEKDIAKNEIIH